MERWRITQGWLQMVPEGFDRTREMGERFLYFFSNSAPSLWGPHRKARAGALGLSLVLIVLLVWRRRDRAFGWPLLLLSLWLGAAWAGPLVLDALRNSYTVVHPRYFLTGLAAALLILGVALGSVPSWMRYGLLAGLCVVWFPDVRSTYQIRCRSDCPLREVAESVERNVGEDDLIVVHAIPTGLLGFARYYPSDAEVASWVEQLGVKKVPGSIESVVRGKKQVHLVIVHHVGAPVPEEAWLRERGEVVEERRQRSARILRFVPRDGPTF